MLELFLLDILNINKVMCIELGAGLSYCTPHFNEKGIVMNEPFKTLTLLEINYYLIIKYLNFQVMNEKIKRLEEEMNFW